MKSTPIEQIKKLLALANCPGATAGDIQAAMGRVAHLAAKNNVSDVEIEKASRENGTEGVRISVNPKDMVDEVAFTASSMGRWDKWLGIAVENSCSVKCYIGWCREKGQTAIRFFGLPQDVAVAKELFAFARKSMGRCTRNYGKDCRSARVTWRPAQQRTFKDGFCMGLIEAAKERTLDASEKTEVEVAGSTALVLVSDIVEAKKGALVVKGRELGLTTGRSTGGRTYGGEDARSAGTAAGRATNLNRNAIS